MGLWTTMQSYRELIGDTYKGLGAKEPVEWSNFWFDAADRSEKRRFLLIGDSTVRMVRSTFAAVAGCPVDMLGSSSSLDDELFVIQTDAFFRSVPYSYEAIFVQMLDMDAVMKGSGYAHIDHIHFEEAAKIFIARKMHEILA